MFSRHNRMIGAFYLCADTLLAFISFWVAWEVRSLLIIPRPLYSLSNYPWIVPLSVGIWIAVGLLAGIYREIKEEDLRRAFTDPLKVGLIATVLLFAATFAIKFRVSQPLAAGALRGHGPAGHDAFPARGTALCRTFAAKSGGAAQFPAGRGGAGGD